MASATNTVKNLDDGRPTFAGPSKPDLTTKIENAGAAGLDRAKEMASSVVHAMGEAEAAVEKKANDATSAVGGGMKSLGATLDKGGRYLQEEGLAGMANEVTECIRRNPITAVLAGIGFGFLLAKLTTRS